MNSFIIIICVLNLLFNIFVGFILFKYSMVPYYFEIDRSSFLKKPWSISLWRKTSEFSSKCVWYFNFRNYEKLKEKDNRAYEENRKRKKEEYETKKNMKQKNINLV